MVLNQSWIHQNQIQVHTIHLNMTIIHQRNQKHMIRLTMININPTNQEHMVTMLNITKIAATIDIMAMNQMV